MTVAELVALVDDLLDAAKEANSEFDYLAFEEEAFPVGGDCFGTYLAANLGFLREKLDTLATDLRTLPVTGSLVTA